MADYPLRPLAEFLLDSFSVTELRMFAAHTYGREVLDSLPGGAVSAREFTYALVEVLNRRGLLDARLLRELTIARPARYQQIRDLAARLDESGAIHGAPPTSSGPGRKLFISYSHRDEVFRAQLDAHLRILQRAGVIDSWDDRKISPGADWEREISENLAAAQYVMLLVSSDFLASDYCYSQELGAALRRHELGDTIIIPVIIRPCLWQESPIARIQALPPDARPVSSWESADEAWTHVVRAVRNMVTHSRASESAIAFGTAEPELRTVGPVSAERNLRVVARAAQQAIGDIFKTAGQPNVTFVVPDRFQYLQAAVQTMGKGLVVEGPSGIGKTTAVKKAIAEATPGVKSTWLSSRSEGELRQLDRLFSDGFKGHLVVDDFHRLDIERRRRLADCMKYVADSNMSDCKLTIIGINRAGYSLVDGFNDLVGRFDRFGLGRQPLERIEELILKGEKAANISFLRRSEFMTAAAGSFYTTQQLCLQAAIGSGVLHTQPERVTVSLGPTDVMETVLRDLDFKFLKPLLGLAASGSGGPVRGGGLALLWLLAGEDDGTVLLDHAQNEYPELTRELDWMRSTGLRQTFQRVEGLSMIAYFDEDAGILVVEDPQLHFYLRNIQWTSFGKKAGLVVSVSPQQRIAFKNAWA